MLCKSFTCVAMVDRWYLVAGCWWYLVADGTAWDSNDWILCNLFKVHLLNDKTINFITLVFVNVCFLFYERTEWRFSWYICGNYIFTIHESALSISWYYTVVEVILKIDTTKSLSPFPLCLTDDPLVLSKTVRKAILTIPFSKYIQRWFCRWRLITNTDTDSAPYKIQQFYIGIGQQ